MKKINQIIFLVEDETLPFIHVVSITPKGINIGFATHKEYFNRELREIL